MIKKESNQNLHYLDNGVLIFLCVGVLAACWAVLGEIAVGTADTSALLVDRLFVIGGALLLITAGTFLARRELRAFSTVMIGATVGIIFFFTWIGCGPLNPTEVIWLLHGDWAQHYAAWEMFRYAPWTWPLGSIQTLWYPVGTSIVYTDALPLFAFLFKPFSNLLPDHFQYVGLWFLISCVLQGAFAALLVRLFSDRVVIVLCGSILFLLAPIFLGRFFHDTLSAHWLLLAGLFLYFRSAPSSWSAEAWPWWLFATFAALVHPYLAAMFLTLLFAHWARRVFIDKACNLIRGASAVLVAVSLTVFSWWLSGAFLIRYRDGSGGQFYGKYSFNLLGFLIPQGFSRIMPNIPLADSAQWEGSAYLGIGILALLVTLGIKLLWQRRSVMWPRTLWPLLAAAALMFFFAVSTVLTIGPWKIIDVPISSPLLATFRSSGRFIWIPYYLILLGVIAGILRHFPAAAASLLASAAIVHIWEFSPMHLHFAHLRTGLGWPKPETLLTDPGWEEIAAGRRHLTMFPPVACGKQAGPYLPFQLFAASHHMTFNSGYLARWDLRATQNYCQQLADDVRAQRFSADDIYVVGRDWEVEVPAGFDCRDLDGYRVCSSEQDNTSVPPARMR